ncbi:uncharacterized protein LOC136034199 [Artemia franciscana]|uniref:uncharacterized protein LOC136034199 n=1 Tax=Artemia franciscana TaxID=6661 RepID=UPI0032DA6AF7
MGRKLPGHEFVKNECCMMCDGYYGPNFGQPVCWTCHLYLFQNDVERPAERPICTSVHDNDEDSGTEEPDVQDVNGQDQQVPRITPRQRPPIIDDEDNIPDQQMQPLDPPPLLDLGDPPQGEPEETGNVNEALHVEREVAELVRFHEGTGVLLIPKSQKKNSEGNSPNQELKKWLQDLSIRRDSDVKSEIVETLPPEVLIQIFSYLDDISLFVASNVCRKWLDIISSFQTPEQWRENVLRRWPFFNPIFVRLGSLYDDDLWFRIYSGLFRSVPCHCCFYDFHTSHKNYQRDLGFKRRTRHELIGMEADPPEGIKGEPLWDSSLTRWIATIQGPDDSPYMGGIFYLSVYLPPVYPHRPPVARFLTKIFHPNVSRHGHIGIDCLGVNWSSALSIAKVLVSIQSLLTDPFCDVCMEPDIGKLYTNDRNRFIQIARAWTYEYAMHDMLTPRRLQILDDVVIPDNYKE